MASPQGRARNQSSRKGQTPKLNYYRSGSPSTSSPFQRTQRSKSRRWLGKTLDVLVITAIAGAFVYNLFVRAEPNLVLGSAAYHSQATYQQAVKQALSGLKNRTKLTFDDRTLAESLKRQFPEISDVSVELPLFGQVPSIHLSIAKPSLLLRGADGTTGALARSVIDAKGVVVGPQQQFKSITQLPLITDETGLEDRKGTSVLSPSEIVFILNVITQAKKAKVPIASLTLPKQAQELDLRTSDRDYFVKFYLGGDASAQTGQFLAARDQFDKTNKQPSQYLDVRVSGKIYYR